MKTLNELWKENGEKPGLKVRRTEWGFPSAHFVIMGKAPFEGFYGYNGEGEACSWFEGKANWTLYQEPEELIPHWPAIVRMLSGDYLITNICYSNLDNVAKNEGFTSSQVIRLATEYPPVMLPRKR